MNDKKRASDTGIRTRLPEGSGEAVAVDQLVDDLLHGNVQGALHTLHEPHGESAQHHEAPTKASEQLK